MEPLAGLMLGLAGGLHCAGMCGPIAMALPKMEGNTTRFVTGRILYQLGRVGTYVILGLLAGFGASAMSLSGYEQTISIVAGSLMILTAVLQIFWHRSLLPSAPVARLTQPVRTSMQKLLKKNNIAAMTGLGAVNGLLPCGLVLSAVFGSVSTTSDVDGAIFMALFGLGTLPVMSAISLGGGWISGFLKGKSRLAMPIIALLLGTVFIVRGMGLGVPYLSPKPPVAEHQCESCH